MENKNYGELMKAANGDVAGKLKVIDDFVSEVMVPGEDYGTIPGISKPSLFKSGAEKLAALFGVYPIKEVVYRDINEQASFKKTNGEVIDGVLLIEVNCLLMDNNGIKMGSGLGACSNVVSKFAKEPGQCYNNVIKMAGKRSLVDAILTLTLVSGKFTQDVEDMPKEDLMIKGAPSGGGYKPSGPPAAKVNSDPSKAQDSSKATISFGPEKGVTYAEASLDALNLMLNSAKKNIREGKYVDKAEIQLATAEAEIKNRG